MIGRGRSTCWTVWQSISHRDKQPFTLTLMAMVDLESSINLSLGNWRIWRKPPTKGENMPTPYRKTGDCISVNQSEKAIRLYCKTTLPSYKHPSDIKSLSLRTPTYNPSHHKSQSLTKNNHNFQIPPKPLTYVLYVVLNLICIQCSQR